MAMKPWGLPRRFGDMPHRSTCCPSTRVILLAGLLTTAGLWSAPAGHAQSPDDLGVHAERVMVRGLSWVQNGYPDRAAAVFSEGLKVHPENPALLGAMAHTQRVLGEFGTARFYLDQALSYAPEQHDLMSQDLDLALDSGDPQAARAAMDRILALDHVEPVFVLRHLSDLRERGPADLSRLLAVQGMAWFPGNQAILEAAVSTLEQTGHLEDATSAAGRLANLTGSWDDTLRLARLQMQLGLWPEAESTLRPLLELDPDDAEARAMWADLDVRLPDRSLMAEAGMVTEDAQPVADADSLGILRAAWMANPDNEATTRSLIKLLMGQGQSREAALLASEHVDVWPRHLEIWVLGTKAWIAAGNQKAAVDLAEAARLLFPGFAPIEVVFAEALAAQGRTDDALRHLDGLMQRWDPSSEAHRSALALRSRIGQSP